MKATYWQNGETIDYVNNTTDIIQANTVVVFGQKVGVIGATISPGEKGVLHTVGVFKMNKNSDEVVAAGTNVYFTGEIITATATGNTLAGYTVQEAKAGVTDILVKLQG